MSNALEESYAKPLAGPKTKQEGTIEVATLRNSGAEIIDIGLPTSADIVTNFEKLQAARKEFEANLELIKNLSDPGMREIQKISAITRIDTILENENIHPRELTSENQGNISRDKYRTELQRLELIKRQLEKL